MTDNTVDCRILAKFLTTSQRWQVACTINGDVECRSYGSWTQAREKLAMLFFELADQAACEK